MQNDTARPLASGLTVLGAVARVLPHLPNFAPVGSISLFAGARMRGWQAYALPLVLMAVTDPFVRGYSAATPLIYTAFLINVWIGTRLRGTENPWKIGAGVLSGSLVFFLLTNFAWLAGSGQEVREEGLADDVLLGVPLGRHLGVLLVEHDEQVRGDQRQQDARNQQHVDDVHPWHDYVSGEPAPEQEVRQVGAD